MGLKRRGINFKEVFQRLKTQLKGALPFVKNLGQKVGASVQRLSRKRSDVRADDDTTEILVRKGPRFSFNIRGWLTRLRNSDFAKKAPSFSIDRVLQHRNAWRRLLVIGFAAAIAHLVTSFLSQLLTSPKASKVPVFTVAQRSDLQKKSIANYNSIFEKTFFDHEGFIPEVGAPGSGKMDLASAHPTSLPLELIGTIVLSREELSVASIRDSAGNTIEAYQKNDPIGNHGATVYKVDYRKIYLLTRTGTLEYLAMPEDQGPVLKTAGVKKPTKGGPVDSVQQEDENTYAVSGKFLKDQIDNNLNDIVSQAKAIPHYENGQIIGFRLLNIKKGGIFDQIGLKDNDIVCEVNDIPLNSSGQGLALFGQLKEMTSGSITVTLCGGGQNRTVTYNVR